MNVCNFSATRMYCRCDLYGISFLSKFNTKLLILFFLLTYFIIESVSDCQKLEALHWACCNRDLTCPVLSVFDLSLLS